MHSSNVSAVDVQAPVVHNDAFYFAPCDTMQVNRTELVFVPRLNISSKDTKTLHDLGDLDFLPIADSLVEAGRTLLYGMKCVKRNREEALRFLELASSLKNTRSQFYIGNVKYWQGDYLSAAEHAIAGCEMGNFDSGNILLQLYKNGYLDSKKRRKSLKWIKKAAQNGNEDAPELAVMRKLVESKTKQDREEAFQMAKAAEQTATSQLILGIFYFYGFGTRKSEEKARASFPESMDKPFSDFFFHASVLYDQSPLILKFMRHFADLDVTAACEILASYFIYAAGNCGSYNEEALKWTKKAADLGSIYSQAAHAFLCESGSLFKVNMSEAYRYYRMAAKQGDHASQIAVARLYINGAGVSRDLSKAKYYLKQAMSSDYEEDRNKARNLWKLIN